jgi:hypothetical protein
VSLVGDGTGAATRVGRGTGEEQGDTGLPDGRLGTGLGAQVGVTVGRPVGTGTGAADKALLGRGLATGAGDSPTAGGAVGEADGAAATGAGVPVTVGVADGDGAPVFSVPALRVAVALAVRDAPDEG